MSWRVKTLRSVLKWKKKRWTFTGTKKEWNWGKPIRPLLSLLVELTFWFLWIPCPKMLVLWLSSSADPRLPLSYEWKVGNHISLIPGRHHFWLLLAVINIYCFILHAGFGFFGFSCQTLSTQLSSCRADQHRTCKRCTFIMGSSSGHPEKSSFRICARTTGNGHRFTGMAAVPDHRHRDFCGNPRW